MCDAGATGKTIAGMSKYLRRCIICNIDAIFSIEGAVGHPAFLDESHFENINSSVLS